MKKSAIKTKLKDIRFKIRYKLFVFGRTWHYHAFFGRFYPQKSIYRRLVAILFSFIIFLPTALFYFRPSPTEAAWFDDSYGYRQQITFIHNAALTNTSMRINISNTNNLITAGKMQPDCDDSRFTDSTGKLLQYRYISGCNSGTTVYDVIFPAVLNGSNLAYFYYGNPTAVSASSSLVPTGTTPSGSVTFATAEKGPAPALYLKFDEGTGTITKDQTSNNNNGGIRGASWQSQKSCPGY